MISKKHRLNERNVKKGLAKGKPFFSYGVVLNYIPNKLQNNRFAIVIGSKVVKNAVVRNFFRRKFYDLASAYLFADSQKSYDFIFVVKKKNKLEKDNYLIFEKDIKFLLKKTNSI